MTIRGEEVDARSDIGSMDIDNDMFLSLSKGNDDEDGRKKEVLRVFPKC